MTMQAVHKAGWGFWFKWILATIIGYILGLLLQVFTDPSTNMSFRLPLVLSQILGWAITGTAVGLLQWDVLRRRIKTIGWWILATAVGWSLGLSLSLFFIYGIAGGGTGIIVGIIVGVAQWLPIRRYVRGAALWIPVNTIAWTIGPAIVWLMVQSFGVDGGVFELFILPIGGGVGAVLIGATTGLAMMWLLNHPKQQMVNR